MRSTTAPSETLAAAPDQAPTLAEGAGLLGELRETLSQLQALQAKAVELAGRVQRSGTVEELEGLPLDLLLGLEHHLTGAERWMLLTAADVLAHLPVTFGLFREGRLSWSQVRGIVGRARHLRVGDRAALDERIAASVDLVDQLDPDQLQWAVDRAADELDGLRQVERREQAVADDNFVNVQLDFHGAGTLYARFDPVATATVVGALDAAAETPTANGQEPGEATTRAKQRAGGLVDICTQYLSGGDGGKARASVVVHVDVDQTTPTAAGTVEVGLPGWLPTISAATLEALARSADVRAVVFDGARPLAATGKVDAESIPADVRLAVQARDLGCRFPGSRAPIGHTDIHHIHWRSDGGDHHPDNLLGLSRRAHRLVHRRGWDIDLDPATGRAAFTRHGRTWTTRPWGTRLRRPPTTTPPDLPPGGGARPAGLGWGP
jgi:hypothetical protein